MPLGRIELCLVGRLYLCRTAIYSRKPSSRLLSDHSLYLGGRLRGLQDAIGWRTSGGQRVGTDAGPFQEVLFVVLWNGRSGHARFFHLDRARTSLALQPSLTHLSGLVSAVGLRTAILDSGHDRPEFVQAPIQASSGDGLFLDGVLFFDGPFSGMEVDDGHLFPRPCTDAHLFEIPMHLPLGPLPRMVGRPVLLVRLGTRPSSTSVASLSFVANAFLM